VARIGAHVSMAGGIHLSVRRALDLGLETFQIFTGSQKRYLPGIIGEGSAKAFKDALSRTDMAPFLVHAGYLINLANPDREIFERSVASLSQEFVRCRSIEAPYLVLHPGSHMGEGVAHGIDRITEGLARSKDLSEGRIPVVLFETTAGHGYSIGGGLDELADLIDAVPRSGVCLDTCHLYAAGQDISTPEGMAEVIDRYGDTFGIDKVKGIHLNDTLSELGSRRDRHAKLGEGVLGEPPFRYLMNEARLKDVPMVLETPGGDDKYRREAIYLKGLRV